MKQGLKLAMTLQPSLNIFSFCHCLEREHPSGEGSDVWEWQQLLVAGKSTSASFDD